MLRRFAGFAPLTGVAVLLLAACSSPPAPVPDAPTGLTITPSLHSIILSWQDNSDSESGFAIYRREFTLTPQADGDEDEFVEVDTVPADTTTYEDDTVEDDVMYQYGISAFGSGGESSVSQPDSTDPVQTVNEPPTADDLSIATVEDTAVAFFITGSDPESQALAYDIVSGPEHGTLSGTAPTLSYTPDPDFNGTDSIEFTVNDGEEDSEPATVTVTVGASSDAPVAYDVIVSTSEDVPVSVELDAFDADGDALSYDIVIAPAFGSLSGEGASRTYTPNADHSGSDSFVYRVNDGAADSNTANVVISISAEDDAPVADSHSVTTDEDTPVSIVLSGSDPDTEELIFSLVGEPEHGSLSGDLPNLLYSPDADFSGSDSLSFTVADGTQESAPATVSITVNAVADAPEFDSVPIAVAAQDAKYSYDITATDADPDDTLTIIVTTKPKWLFFRDNGDGSASLEGTPGNAELGSHDVVLTVVDAAGASDTQSFTVTVNNEN